MDSMIAGKSIEINQIENFEQFKNLINNLYCCVCLKIPLCPLECYSCGAIFCDDCYEIMKIASKKCVTFKCDGNVKTANKFIRENISNFKLFCQFCNLNGIPHSDYKKHLEQNCDKYRVLDNKREKYIQVVRENNEKIEEITKKINNIKLNTTMSILSRKGSSNSKKETLFSKEQIRKMLLSFTLSTDEKMLLYNSVVEGNLSTFKSLVYINKYPIFEEISAHNYFWTSLHYAMHYGQASLIDFILDICKEQNKLDLALNLQSSDNRCPTLCLLRSNSLNEEKKRILLDKVLKKYKFKFSQELFKEARTREMEDIFKKYYKMHD